MDDGVANEPTESGVGDEELTMEYQGSKEDVASEGSISASGVQ